MLREELKDEDIPHRTQVRTRILEIWDEHLDRLADEMKVKLSTLFSCSVSNSDFLEITWENLIHNGYVVRYKSVPFHGSDGALD